MKNQITVFIIVFSSCIAWSIFGNSVSAWIYLSLTQINIPVPIIQLALLVLPLILLLEVVLKFILWQTLPPLKFIPTQAESWENINQEELTRYTSELENLGFFQLTDYTFPSSQNVARLFAHPQAFCFAEIGIPRNQPVFCSISCHLENNWVLAVTDISSQTIVWAVWYAFFRQPHCLVKQFEDNSINVLFQAILDWRKQVSRDLDLKVMQDVTVETYFERENRNRKEQRHSLLFKSITWALLEVLWFSRNPQSEWLGNYSKFKQNSKA